MQKIRLSLQSFFALAVTTSLLLFSTNADAAERAVLKYKIFRGSVSVPELATFAETGELSSELGAYLRMSGRSPEEVRQALNQEIHVNPVVLHRVLNSPVGNTVLDEVSQVIHTPDRVADRQALRGAVMMSALSGQRMSLIEVLQNYPTPEVHVDGDRLIEVYGRLSRLAARLPGISLRF